MSTCQSFQSKKMLATTVPNKQMLSAITVISTNINAFIQVIDHIRNQDVAWKEYSTRYCYWTHSFVKAKIVEEGR